MKKRPIKFIKTKTIFFSKKGEIKKSTLFLSNLIKKYYIYTLSKGS
jgi:hypothetical protein